MHLYTPVPQVASSDALDPLDKLPAGFDPIANPIIARHFFGVEPFRPIGEVAAQVVADLRFRRQVLRLHRLGPRAIAEFLAEIGAERAVMTVIDQKLDTYAELDPETLEVVGGADFSLVPVHEVRRAP